MRAPFLVRAFALAAPLMVCAQEANIDKCAATLAGRIAGPQGVTVAVVDFSDLQGRVTELGRYYAEELSVALVNSGKELKVIDRAHLQTLLKELKFQNSGMIDERTASELGRLAGVNVLITGSVTELADSVRLTVKAMTTKTAAIQAAASLSLPKNPTTMALLRRDVGNGAISGAASSTTAAAPNARMFQNDFLTVTVEAIALRKERNTAIVHMTLAVENKSAEEVFIGTRKSDLMDSLGRTWYYRDHSGIAEVKAIYEDNRSNYTRLAPGTRQTVVYSFRGKEEVYGPLEGGTASFAIEMVRHIASNANRGRGEGQRFSVGVANISMTVAPEPKPAPARAR